MAAESRASRVRSPLVIRNAEVATTTAYILKLRNYIISSVPAEPSEERDRHLCAPSLYGEELELGGRAPVGREAAQAAARGDHPVARHDDGEGVSSQSLADGPALAGGAGQGRNLAVGEGRS